MKQTHVLRPAISATIICSVYWQGIAILVIKLFLNWLRPYISRRRKQENCSSRQGMPHPVGLSSISSDQQPKTRIFCLFLLQR